MPGVSVRDVDVCLKCQVTSGDRSLTILQAAKFIAAYGIPIPNSL
jgi:hypothetical protein